MSKEVLNYYMCGMVVFYILIMVWVVRTPDPPDRRTMKPWRKTFINYLGFDEFRGVVGIVVMLASALGFFLLAGAK